MDGTEQVLPSGFEPETLALLAPRSNQLSYRSIRKEVMNGRIVSVGFEPTSTNVHWNLSPTP